MSKSFDINVRHVTRVEGHGNILAKVRDGKIEKIEWQVPEAPRFFEAMVRGRSWDEIQPIVSRICGICSVSHSLVAVKAVEEALDVTVSEQADKLRLLLHYSEQLQSHVLHVGYLVAPDLLGVKSVVPLASSHLDVVKTIIAVHRFANEWTEMQAGRVTHPITLVPGGFTKYPVEKDLLWLKKGLEDSVPKLKAIAEVVLSVAGAIPDFTRDTEYISLFKKDTYAFYHGDIASTDVPDGTDVHKFESVVNEYVSPQSTAKWCKWHRDSYAVGALARYNNSAEYLKPLAKTVAGMFGLKKGCCNPFFNSVAQVVEAVQVVEHSLQLVDELLTSGVKHEKFTITPKAGEGAAAVEAPRGILFHRYRFDAKGKCEKANCVIPTNQNHANIQKDFEKLLPQIIDQDEAKIRLAMEMLVRSYDPCISCSTHYLDVEFLK